MSFELFVRLVGYASIGLFVGWTIAKLSRKSPKETAIYRVYLLTIIAFLFVYAFSWFMELIGRLF